MAPPRYARFHKCDLQLQTPADRTYWTGVKTRLSAQATDEEIGTAAKIYVARCYEVGLEVVGFTDHNMGGALGQRFLDQVRTEVRAQAGRGLDELVVFPGFELMAKIPGNIHLLCLFEPRTPTEEVSNTLTKLGIAPSERTRGAASNCGLDEVLDCVESRGGIVVAAHCDAPAGVLDDRRQAEAWQQDVITNPRLLCIELLKPRATYERASSKLGDIVRNDRGHWHREHPLAVVNSSDCKRLDPDDGPGDENWIGKRSTWIKMGRPSVEALRQAFLDHESRIRFGDKNPDESLRRARIERIAVRGTDFVADQVIDLSPRLNVIIGGGGTGKSTLIECTRAALGQPPDTAKDVLQNHRRALSSLGTGTVELDLKRGDDPLTVSLDGSQNPREDRFPIIAFSQREVFAVADSAPATLELLDSLQRDRMDKVKRDERRTVSNLKEIDVQLAALPGLLADNTRVEAEIELLQSTLEALERQQEPLARLNALRKDEDRLQGVDKRLQGVADTIERFANTLTEPTSPGATPGSSRAPAAAPASYEHRAAEALRRAQRTVESAAESINEFLAGEQSLSSRQELRATIASATAEYESLLQETQGDEYNQPEAIRRQLAEREDEAQDLQAKIATLHDLAGRRHNAVSTVRAIWRRQSTARQELADRLRELVPRTQGGKPYVEVAIEPHADLEPLQLLLCKWVHGNALNPDEAAQIAQLAMTHTAATENPVDTLTAWVRDLKVGRTPPELAGLRSAALKGLDRDITDERLHELERLRLPDKARVLLRRHDGTEAGWLDAGLSVGQRCTAIIALALAAGDTPILFDQPEDEIANEFIFNELVPLLRQARESRQVILVTHDPNLPVVGDAELVYALETRRAEGGHVVATPKLVHGDQAVGSLDRPAVKEAVALIMEGSDVAFKRRMALYGF